ncbi:hypothetical protein GGX14DRAFT_634932 [Mycena pura]|uniref:Uncharacterized protein n=1 Tax=Mycena pura TaxID=153505 RepID=A0AAD6VIK7_9AGAR|nr:hypothetical protein GGX14DRAFT_634932 [Mycena pura]
MSSASEASRSASPEPYIRVHYAVHDTHHRSRGTLEIDVDEFGTMLVAELIRLAQEHHRGLARSCVECLSGQSVLLKSAWLVAVSLNGFDNGDDELPPLPLLHTPTKTSGYEPNAGLAARSDDNHIRVIFETTYEQKKDYTPRFTVKRKKEASPERAKKKQTTERVAARPAELSVRNFDSTMEFWDIEQFDLAPPGHNFYASAEVPSIDSGVVLIDKSKYIEDFDNAFKLVNCLIAAAPPSTGKTTNLQMLEAWYDCVNSPDDLRRLFGGPKGSAASAHLIEQRALGARSFLCLVLDLSIPMKAASKDEKATKLASRIDAYVAETVDAFLAKYVASSLRHIMAGVNTSVLPRGKATAQDHILQLSTRLSRCPRMDAFIAADHLDAPILHLMAADDQAIRTPAAFRIVIEKLKQLVFALANVKGLGQGNGKTGQGNGKTRLLINTRIPLLPDLFISSIAAKSVFHFPRLQYAYGATINELNAVFNALSHGRKRGLVLDDAVLKTLGGEPIPNYFRAETMLPLVYPFNRALHHCASALKLSSTHKFGLDGQSGTTALANLLAVLPQDNRQQRTLILLPSNLLSGGYVTLEPFSYLDHAALASVNKRDDCLHALLTCLGCTAVSLKPYPGGRPRPDPLWSMRLVSLPEVAEAVAGFTASPAPPRTPFESIFNALLQGSPSEFADRISEILRGLNYRILWQLTEQTLHAIMEIYFLLTAPKKLRSRFISELRLVLRTSDEADRIDSELDGRYMKAHPHARFGFADIFIGGAGYLRRKRAILIELKCICIWGLSRGAWQKPYREFDRKFGQAMAMEEECEMWIKILADISMDELLRLNYARWEKVEGKSNLVNVRVGKILDEAIDQLQPYLQTILQGKGQVKVKMGVSDKRVEVDETASTDIVAIAYVAVGTRIVARVLDGSHESQSKYKFTTKEFSR